MGKTSKSGIYLIENKITKEKYIGKSIDISRRWMEHKIKHSTLNKEYDKPLYRAFRKYGIENFNFKIVEECLPEELNDKETYWIEKYDTYHSGYNCTIGGDGNVSLKGEKHPKCQISEKIVIEIRKKYEQHFRKKDVYKQYSNILAKHNFDKIWKGETWKDTYYHVYTQENKNFHKHNTANKGSDNGMSILNEKDIIEIRERKKHGEKSQDVYKDYCDKIKKGSFYNIWSNQNWYEVKPVSTIPFVGE